MPGAGVSGAACGATSSARSRRTSCAPQSPGGALAGPIATSARVSPRRVGVGVAESPVVLAAPAGRT
eukprot:7678044-Lingulodinium_polyedra.AAC.1